MNKVISTALFGKNTRYAVYWNAFLRAHLTLFPISEGWRLRVHVDEHNLWLKVYADAGLCDVVPCDDAPLTRAMLWRMKPVWDESVDYVFCRDIDALPTPRDRACCDQFIASGLDVQTIHDSVSHDGILGGLSGYNCESFREQVKEAGIHSWDDLVRFGKKTDDEWARHGGDQDVLNALCLGWGREKPGARLAIFEHRYAGWAGGKPGTGERKPSSWATISEPTPNTLMPVSEGDKRFVGGQADSLCSHLGAAGFDYEIAEAFYDDFGPMEIMSLVRSVKT